MMIDDFITKLRALGFLCSLMRLPNFLRLLPEVEVNNPDYPMKWR